MAIAGFFLVVLVALINIISSAEIHQLSQSTSQIDLATLALKFTQLESRLQNQELEIASLKRLVRHYEDVLAPSREHSKISIADGKANVTPVAVLLPRTCIEALQSGLPEFRESGMYWIDPDGVGVGEPAMYVFCDMTSGTTAVLHDSEATIAIPRCIAGGCYSRNIVYQNATQTQIRSLIELSSHCEQPIKVDCVQAPLTPGTAWWEDLAGNQNVYWTGEGPEHTCQCGVENSCVLSDVKCNCDADVAVLLVDTGVLSKKDSLPVMKLNFGKIKYDGGSHTLGRLKCSGRKATSETYPTSCLDLWILGYSLNGFYPIRNGVRMDYVFCDFSQGQNVAESRIGYVDVKSDPVYFFAQRSTSYTATTVEPSTVPFQTVQNNVGSAMDVTTGVFTAPKRGVYLFEFMANDTPGGERLMVNLYKNDERIASTYADNHGAAPIPSILDLAEGDQVMVKIDSPDMTTPTLFGNATWVRNFVHFTGVLLEEDIFP